jgi:hypothetical protein
MKVQLHAFLTSALDGSEWSASCPGCFTSSAHWIGGWAGPRAGLNVVAKRTGQCTTEIFLMILKTNILLIYKKTIINKLVTGCTSPEDTLQSAFS